MINQEISQLETSKIKEAMRQVKNMLITIILFTGFFVPKAFGQQIDTVYSYSFEQPISAPINSNCNYEWERTSDSANDGTYSLGFESGLAQAGCVTSTVTQIFNVSDIDPNDTLFLAIDFFKSNPTADDFVDAVQFSLVDDQGQDIANLPFFRNTQMGAQVQSPGWYNIFTFVPGQTILDSTSSNNFAFQILAQSGGNGADMALDNIDVTFRNYSQEFVSLLAPNGGEQLEQSEDFDIEWDASANVNQVDLAYSDDNGNSWNTIASNVNSAQGSYQWSVPNTTTNQGLVRVRSSNDPSLTDISQSTFSISDPAPEITITNPSDFSNLTITNTETIEWNSFSTDQVDIEYSTNNGNNWATIETNVDASLESYDWVVPNTPAPGTGMIRILNSSNNNFGDTVTDLTIESNNVPALTQTEPSENDTFKTNTQVNIEWVANDQVDTVDILFSETDGNTWNEVVTGVDASEGSYNWTTPSDPVTTARIQIVDADNNSIVDISGRFYIVDAIRNLSLNLPSQEDTLDGGSNYTIEWTASADVNNVLIEFSDDGGNSWEEVASNVNAGQESYDWSVPSETIEEAVIRLTDEGDNTVSAESGTFYIDGSTSLESIEEASSLNLFPNPATNRVNVEIPDSFSKNDLQISVVSMKGKVQSVPKTIKNGQIKIDVDNLAKGIYYVKIVHGKSQHIGKFAKQ